MIQANNKITIRRSLALTSVVFVLLAIHSQVSTGFESPLIKKLSAALEAQNTRAAVQIINEAKRVAYEEEVLSYMRNLWEGSETITLPKEVLEKPIIRINVADLLVQASHNRLLDINEVEFQRYARQLLNSDEIEVSSVAFFVLARIDDPNDVEVIEPFALMESQYLARSAIVAIAMMCNGSAKESLQRIETTLNTQEMQIHLRKTREQFDRLKKSGHLCKGSRDG